MATVTGTLVSEGGPRPSIAFVHDDPTLCSAAEWWSGLARLAAALVAAFALAAAAACLVVGAPVVSLALWALAGGAGGACARLAAAVRRERRIAVSEARPQDTGPAPRPTLLRLAGALLARAWVAWSVIVIAGGQRTPGHALAAAAWAPAATAAWTAGGAAVAAWRIRRLERRRGVEVLFAAGTRQRALAPPVIRAAPR
jgi:hypothetical protein